MDFLGASFLKGDRETSLDTKNIEFIGLYFSASWCMPCRYFTQTLMGFYVFCIQNIFFLFEFSNKVIIFRVKSLNFYNFNS